MILNIFWENSGYRCGRDSAAEKASAAGDTAAGKASAAAEAVSHFSQNCCEHFAGKYATNFIKAERIHNITARCKAQAA